MKCSMCNDDATCMICTCIVKGLQAGFEFVCKKHYEKLSQEVAIKILKQSD